jgi:hypothetical protein
LAGGWHTGSGYKQGYLGQRFVAISFSEKEIENIDRVRNIQKHLGKESIKEWYINTITYLSIEQSRF